MNRHQLEQQIQDCLDGRLSDTEQRELFSYLKQDPEAMRLYCLSSAMDTGLSRLAKGELSLSSDAENFAELAQRSQKQKMARVSILSAAAILAISLVVMRLFFVDSEQPPSVAFQTSPGTQFTLTHDGANNQPVGQSMQPGSRLRLSQGCTELNFGSGVKAIVMAPADLTLHSDKQLYLGQGTAWFHVPKGAEGFTVKTRELDIVDLGTEFGVLAKANDHDEVHVLDGKIEVTALRLRKESTTLIAGEARRIDPVGRLVTIPTKRENFLASLPSSLPFLHWSFDQQRGYQVSGNHPAAGEIHTKAIGSPLPVPGKNKEALSLNGKGQHVITDWQGFAGKRPRTVAFWLKIPAHADYRKNPGIVGWGDRTQKNGKWKVTLDNEGPHTPTQMRLSWGNSWITANQPIQPDQWQHITITSTGKLNAKGLPQADIYLNGHKAKTIPGAQGAREATAPKTTIITNQAVPLMIGCDLYPDIGKRKFFTGEIDELKIFDGYMSEKEAKHLFAQ
ncbi:FecR domain-containing protein [Verrucomicrobiaceae bacterium N1E253]|uniref:FecR domain-containing protein n=1 Tax=Oceaniferula marina TaxID=2748318 RepID=A0A851GBE1_9BACT|nr:LamG-like jellyroll fold domain-containing protein [Oceaniferula marina]NWK55068.1 FecR domain-containing protein [Oceaniferula marina]